MRRSKRLKPSSRTRIRCIWCGLFARAIEEFAGSRDQGVVMRIVAAIVFPALLIAQQAANPPEPGTLSGKVLDSKGAVLRKATVTLHPTGVVVKPGEFPPADYEGSSDA